jgi:hypothetical protein
MGGMGEWAEWAVWVDYNHPLTRTTHTSQPVGKHMSKSTCVPWMIASSCKSLDAEEDRWRHRAARHRQGKAAARQSRGHGGGKLDKDGKRLDSRSRRATPCCSASTAGSDVKVDGEYKTTRSCARTSCSRKVEG